MFHSRRFFCLLGHCCQLVQGLCEALGTSRLALVSLAETRNQAVRLAEEFLQADQRRRLQAAVNGGPGRRRVEVDPALPRSGDEVLCVLLPEKTRQGGWRARLLNRSLAGPITNTGDVPSGVQAGQRVVLLVEAICSKKGRVQFHWVAG